MLPYPTKTFYILLLIFFGVFVIISFFNFGYAYSVPTEDTNKPENVSVSAIKYLYVINILMGVIFIILLVVGIYLLSAKYNKSAAAYEKEFSEIGSRKNEIKIKTLEGNNNALIRAFNNISARLKSKEETDPMSSPDPIIRLTPDSGKIQKLVVRSGVDSQGKPSFKYLDLPSTKDGDIVGILVKPESAGKNNGWKNVSFDIETQKCYNLQSNDQKKSINTMIAPEDPRMRGSIPSETAMVSQNWRDNTGTGGDGLMNLLPGAGGYSGYGGGCAPCGQVPQHPEYMTNSCGQLKPVGPCGTIYSTALNIGRVNYK
jgi:hypothetical protein